LNIAKNNLLALEEGWDGEGSLPFLETTFLRAKRFIVQLFADFWIRNKQNLDVPALYPSSNGSIDIEWDTDNLSILITIPEKIFDQIGIFGKNPRTDSVFLADFYIHEKEKIEQFLTWLKAQY